MMKFRNAFSTVKDHKSEIFMNSDDNNGFMPMEEESLPGSQFIDWDKFGRAQCDSTFRGFQCDIPAGGHGGDGEPPHHNRAQMIGYTDISWRDDGNWAMTKPDKTRRPIPDSEKAREIVLTMTPEYIRFLEAAVDLVELEIEDHGINAQLAHNIGRNFLKDVKAAWSYSLGGDN